MDVLMDQEIFLVEVEYEFIINVYNWFDNESMGFNELQMCVFKMVMIRKFVVI